MTKTVALIKARGNGSTLYRKNVYPLLGRPLISYAFSVLLESDFIDCSYVWTEDEEISAIARDMGVIPLERPLSMVHYHAGFHTEIEFNHHSIKQIKEHLGCNFDNIISFNCNNILLKSETLKAMFQKLMQDEQARSIATISPVMPWLCLDNGNNGLFPFMNDTNMPESERPLLYRRGGVGISKCGLAVAALSKCLYHEISPVEGFDFQSEYDVDFAEFHLLNRK